MTSEFTRLAKLPPYVFNVTGALKNEYISKGIDIVDFSMGNPDQATPSPVIEEMIKNLDVKGAHRYTESQGIFDLRSSMQRWLEGRLNISLDPHNEIIVTLGSKEGISHLSMAMINPNDIALVPDPCYPIHKYAFVLAGANVISINGTSSTDLLSDIKKQASANNVKVVILNFPTNPTTECIDIGFFEEVVALAKKYKFWVIHDFAYADITFDGYNPPSILQVDGAKEVAVETYSMSKSFHMPGWRIGFVYGNSKLVGALKRIKSYYDYGTYGPIQRAAAYALDNHAKLVPQVIEKYRHRRDYLVNKLSAAGWEISSPKATMFLWAKIPNKYKNLNSLDFAKLLLQDAHIAVTPGSAFGERGDSYVRLSLIEDDERVDKAANAIQNIL